MTKPPYFLCTRIRRTLHIVQVSDMWNNDANKIESPYQTEFTMHPLDGFNEKMCNWEKTFLTINMN